MNMYFKSFSSNSQQQERHSIECSLHTITLQRNLYLHSRQIDCCIRTSEQNTHSTQITVDVNHFAQTQSPLQHPIFRFKHFQSIICIFFLFQIYFVFRLAFSKHTHPRNASLRLDSIYMKFMNIFDFFCFFCFAFLNILYVLIE